MESIALVAVLEICLQTLVHQHTLYLLHVELILVPNQLDKRHLIERVDVIDCTAEVPQQPYEAKLASESSVEQRSRSIDV